MLYFIISKIFLFLKYRANELLIALRSLHVRSDRYRGTFPQTLFVQNLQGKKRVSSNHRIATTKMIFQEFTMLMPGAHQLSV